ncbi:hypothetical protein MXB_5012, partial [Myxobolus squamalis]
KIIAKVRGHVFVKDLNLMTLPLYRYLRNNHLILRRYWIGDNYGEYHQALTWITNDMLSHMRYNGPTLIDSTFCPIVSFVLLIFSQTSKSECVYCTQIHELIVLTKYFWILQPIIVDFEKLQKIYGASKARAIEEHAHLFTKIDSDKLELFLEFIQAMIQIDINLEPFKTYFKRTCLKKYTVTLWNVNEIT